MSGEATVNKVILADDEKWSIYGLQHLISWKDYQCEIIDTAQDGVDALQKCREHKPDLLISDIRMPEMDGLELVRALSMELPETTVILVTGYSDLEYAQAALRLGVFDYLIKQVSAEDLDRVLTRYHAYKQKKRVASSSQLYFSLFDDSNDRSVAECMDELGIEIPFAYCYAATLIFDEPILIRSAQVNQTASELQVAFHTGTNRITCFCLSSAPSAYHDTIRNSLKLGQPLFVGLSLPMKKNESFFQVYRQSNIAVTTALFWRMDKPCVYQKVAKSDALSSLAPLQRSLAHGETSLLRHAMDELFQSARDMQIDAFESIVNHFLSLFIAHRIGGYDAAESIDLMQFANTGGTHEELVTTLRSHLEGDNGSSQNAHLLVHRVLDYIDLHFTDDLQASEIAKQFFINPSYLSTLIRKTTGRTFTDIVSGKRIEYAKELLLHTNLPVLDIIQKTGYHEYSYFNKLFKRVTGLTPTQFRLNEGKEN